MYNEMGAKGIHSLHVWKYGEVIYNCMCDNNILYTGTLK